jgi:thioredoxin 1
MNGDFMPIPEIKNDEFEKETADGIVLVDFFTPTCGPCRMMAPVLESCKDFVKIIKVDASKELDLGSKFGIKAVPTLVFFKDGQEVKRVVGVHSKVDIMKLVGELVA